MWSELLSSPPSLCDSRCRQGLFQFRNELHFASVGDTIHAIVRTEPQTDLKLSNEEDARDNPI